MTKLMVEPTLQATLTAQPQPLELCDAAGQVFGYFLSPAELARLRIMEAEHRRIKYAHANSQFTDEELAEDEKDETTYTTKEVIQYLEGL